MLLLHPPSQVAPQSRNTTFYFSGKICGDNKEPHEHIDERTGSVCQTPTNPLYSAGTMQYTQPDVQHWYNALHP